MSCPWGCRGQGERAAAPPSLQVASLHHRLVEPGTSCSPAIPQPSSREASFLLCCSPSQSFLLCLLAPFPFWAIVNTCSVALTPCLMLVGLWVPGLPARLPHIQEGVLLFAWACVLVEQVVSANVALGLGAGWGWERRPSTCLPSGCPTRCSRFVEVLCPFLGRG